jgi:membrane protein implicated in regulation of membrane protease activity
VRRALGDAEAAAKARAATVAVVKAFPWMQVIGSIAANLVTFMVIRRMLEDGEKPRKKRKYHGGFDGI